MKKKVIWYLEKFVSQPTIGANAANSSNKYQMAQIIDPLANSYSPSASLTQSAFLSLARSHVCLHHTAVNFTFFEQGQDAVFHSRKFSRIFGNFRFILERNAVKLLLMSYYFKFRRDSKFNDCIGSCDNVKGPRSQTFANLVLSFLCVSSIRFDAPQ